MVMPRLGAAVPKTIMMTQSLMPHRHCTEAAGSGVPCWRLHAATLDVMASCCLSRTAEG